MGRWSLPPVPARWGTAPATTFVGRDREIAAVETAWLAAGDGARQVVFLGGEPGAGKSRLVAECCLALRRQGVAVLVGRCVTELGSPYQPFHEPAAALLDALGEGAFDGAGRRQAHDRADRLRTLAGIAEPAPDDVLDGAGPRPLDERRQTFQALVEVIAAAAEQRPVVLALEDVHWASPTALQLLAYLVEHTDSCRLLVLATHRTTAPDRSEALSHVMSRLFRLDGVQRIDLPPLDTEDIARFLIVEAGATRARARSAAVILRDRTGGNPFFLREMWSYLSGRGGITAVGRDDDPPPQVIQDTVLLRTTGLTVQARGVLDLAAVVGEEVDVPTLAAVSPTSDVFEALDSLVTCGLLSRTGGARTTYRFTHALTREVLLADMAILTRARAHADVAHALEARGAPVTLLAHHFAGAQLLGYEDKAVHYLCEAAVRADRALAHSEASQLYERAASVASERATSDEMLLAAAHSSLLACDFARSRDLSLAVATDGSPDNRLRAATAYEDSAWYSGGSGDTARELLSRLLPVTVPDDDEPAYVRALAGLGRATALTGEHDTAASLVDRALALAQRHDDPELYGAVLAASMQVGYRPGGRALKRRRAEELVDIATADGMWLYVGPASYHRCVIAYQDADLAALDDSARALRRVGEAIGHRYWTYLAKSVDFARSLLTADFPAATALCASLLEMGAGFGEDDTDGPYGVQSFMVRRETGGLEAVRPLITGAESPADNWAPGLLALFTELGLTDPARRALHYVIADDPGWARHQARWPANVGFAAEAAVALEDADAAAQVLPWLDEFAGTNLVMGPFTAVFGAADRLIAALRSLLGAPDADDWFESALDLDTRSRAPLHRAHTLAQWARHAARAGDTGKAADLARQARELSGQLGLVRVTAVLASVNEDELAFPDGLTEREAEVLRLLGDGLSNRDLAARLYISENTVANHVRSILLKTGCANRTQAAMYAARHGLLARR